MYFCSPKLRNMRIKQLYKHLILESKELILESKSFWDKKKEGPFDGRYFNEYFLPLVLLAGVGVFLGEIIWSDEYLISYALASAVRTIFNYLAQFFILIPILQAVQNNNGGIKDRNRTGLVLAYSLFPFVAASFITGLFPGLYVLDILGLYGFYIFIVGTKACMGLSQEHQTKYMVLSILLILLVWGMVNMVSARIVQSLYLYGS